MNIKEKFKEYLRQELEKIKESGLYKKERIITSPQDVEITVEGRENKVLNFCANNYLGLANHPRIIEAVKNGVVQRGYGMASVGFICGTQDCHKILEKKISEFLGTGDALLYSSCAAANETIFEVLLGTDDIIISDALNHATIIDGIRLWRMIKKRTVNINDISLRIFHSSGDIDLIEGSQVQQILENGNQKILDGIFTVFPENRVYKHNDMRDLEKHLQEARHKECRFILIVTDGVFSMDGEIAKLKEICDLAKKYGALVMVDDSHATGFLGEKGRGSIERCGVLGRVDIVTSTLGKALGGASGGFVASSKEIIEILRQRSRPYLFSNSLPPVIVSAAIEALNLVRESDDLRKKLSDNTLYFRKKITDLGFDIIKSEHPIVPIMLYDAKRAAEMAAKLLDEGIYVIAFSYPVVPRDKARIRVQISATMTKKHLDFALEKFAKIGREMKIIGK